MSETEKQPRPLPRIIMDEAAEAAYSIDPTEVADTFEAASVKDVASHTLDVSSKRRFNGGATAPKWLDRLVNPRTDDNEGKGAVIRVHTATKMRPELRTPEALNELLAHEARHVAQIEQGDKSLTAGFATMIALSALGAVAGNRLAKRGGAPAKAAATIVGGLAGYKAGYQAAAHERHARSHAEHNVSTAFKAKGTQATAEDFKAPRQVKKRGLRERYFKPKSMENEKLYRRLGVVAYNKHINPNSTTNKHPRAQAYREKRLPGGNLGGLPPSATHLERIETFEDISKRNEAIHLGGLALNAGLELALKHKGAPKWARAANVAFAVAGNVYPILVQRNNRLRTKRVLKKLHDREAISQDMSETVVKE